LSCLRCPVTSGPKGRVLTRKWGIHTDFTHYCGVRTRKSLKDSDIEVMFSRRITVLASSLQALNLKPGLGAVCVRDMAVPSSSCDMYRKVSRDYVGLISFQKPFLDHEFVFFVISHWRGKRCSIERLDFTSVSPLLAPASKSGGLGAAIIGISVCT
jgi:hypothetical protein